MEAHFSEAITKHQVANGAQALELEDTKAAKLTATTPYPQGDPQTEIDQGIRLSWRSWLVVFVTCFAIVAQVFVVTAAGSVIAFIIRDLGGDAGLAGWIIRAHNPRHFPHPFEWSTDVAFLKILF
jgi:hypothetical protein